MKNIHISLTSKIKLFGNERMNFELNQFVVSEKLAKSELLKFALFNKNDCFSIHYNGKFVGPFNEHCYSIENFEISPNSFAELLKFYNKLNPIYTNHNRLENPVVILDYLKLITSNYESVKGVFFTFKFNYTNKNETICFPIEEFQFDYYYLFAFLEDMKITIGRIWYD